MPQLFHRTLGIPDALRNNQYLPWLASPDLRNYSFRQQLEWKDRLYVDVAFVTLSDQVHLIRCNCVNRTDLPNDFGIHLFAAMELNPQEKTWISLS